MKRCTMASASTFSPRSAVAERRIVARLATDPLVPEAELAALLAAAADGAGAVVSFTGLVRGGEGAVDALVLEHHPTLTPMSLEAIAAEAFERFGLTVAWVVHRSGRIPAGAPIVFAGAAAPHRRDAFAAADYLMDRLKTEAVLWKREVGPAGERWVEPSASDHDDRARWEA